MTGRRALVLVTVLSHGCVSPPPAPPQVLVHVDTDAPVVGDPNVPWLFDRLRVDAYAPGEATPRRGCVEEFPVDSGSFTARRVSFGFVAPASVAGYRLRVRLFRHDARENGEPRSDASLDVTYDLPPTKEGVVLERVAFLKLDDLATPQTGELAEGNVEVSRVGTWASARRTPCAGTPRLNEVCVPGGAFWMGHPLSPAGIDPTSGAHRLRLVVLTPFFLQTQEVTVGEYRKYVARGGRIVDGMRWSGRSSGAEPRDFCAYADDGSRDALPMNCVSWADARGYCASVGATIPSEAQLEYALGGLRSERYLWGDDEPRCGDADFGRGWPGVSIAECEGAPGPRASGGAGARLDRLVLSDGVVRDLAGSVTEWAFDDFAPQGSSCWPDGILLDPVCRENVPSAKGLGTRTAKGGNYAGGAFAMRAAYRWEVTANLADPTVGFRCARGAR